MAKKKDTPEKETKKPNAAKPKVSGSANADEDIPMNEDALKAGRRMPMMIHAQYVKDISFENPNAPFTLLPGSGRPEIEVNFAMDARKMDMEKLGNADSGIENLYEVILTTTVKATKQGKPAFLVEIEYGMSVSLNQIPEEQHHSMLLIEMPKYMFPYVRQLVAELSGQGGYMPLMLAPVNFSKFYMDRFGKNAIMPNIDDAEKVKELKEKANS